MAESFTHLHVASAFSAPHGVSSPDELAAAASAGGASALACTDRDGLYGSLRHIAACRAEGIDPIVGVDLAILAEPELAGTELAGTETDDDGGARRARSPRRGGAGEAGRVVVLAHGRDRGAGWKALCRLVTTAHAHTGGRAGRAVPVGVLRSELAAACLDPATGRAALTVLLGHDSDVGRAMSGSRYLRPRTLFRAWLDALPAGVLAVELATHGTARGEALSTGHAVRMLRLASEHHIPAVLTNAVRRAEEASSAPGEPPAAGQSWLKPAPLMRELGRELVGSAGLGAKDLGNLLGNTERIADRCRLDPATDLAWGRPADAEASPGGMVADPLRELKERCRTAVPRRYPAAPRELEDEVAARLGHELGGIEGLGLARYFLTVAEVAETIRGLGVRSAVRGRGAWGLVTYLLGISDVDPVRHRLAFEDFVAPDHLTPPDIGLDVESTEVDRVRRGIVERFGAERVALLGAPPEVCPPDAGPARGLDAQFAAALELPVGPSQPPEPLPPPGAMVPCGVIIGEAGFLERMPVQPSGIGPPLSQFGRHDLDPRKLCVLEIRGSRRLGSMAFAVREIERVEGTAVDPACGVAAESEWLEAHHPAAFLAGKLEHEPDSWPRSALAAEARRLGVPVLPLDINESGETYRVERVPSGQDAGRLGIRLPLGSTGISAVELGRIVAGQPYGSIAELGERARVKPSSIQRLAEAGAFDSLHRDAARRGCSADVMAQLARFAPRAPRRTTPMEGQLPLGIGAALPA